MEIVDVHVKNLRPRYQNLQEWMSNENNVYCGRGGVVFIDGKRFPPQPSPWHNPYKDGSRKEILSKYEKYVKIKIREGTLNIELLRGKCCGCWCINRPIDEEEPEEPYCHLDILKKLLLKSDPLGRNRNLSMAKLVTIDLQTDYDYLIFDPGYIDRLVKKKSEILKQIEEARQDEEEDQVESLIFFAPRDSNGLKRIKVADDPDGVYQALKKVDKKLGVRGAICFRNVVLDTEYQEIIGQYQHCGFFSLESYPSFIARFETENGKTVLFKQFDTESG